IVVDERVRSLASNPMVPRTSVNVPFTLVSPIHCTANSMLECAESSWNKRTSRRGLGAGLACRAAFGWVAGFDAGFAWAMGRPTMTRHPARASRRVTPCMGQSSTSGRARFQPWHPRAPAAGRQEPWDEQEVWRDDGTGRRNGTAAPGRWGRPFEECLPRAERDHFFVL